jgi:putative FmdB family regulatory protein
MVLTIMPMHEYRCRDCGNEFEMLVRASDVPACPSCESRHLDRLLSMFAVSSAARSEASLAKAKRQYQQNKNRVDQLRHQGEEVREHLQDDYGIDVGRTTPPPHTK